jgi:uncharacterized protein (TIGR03000 family)
VIDTSVSVGVHVPENATVWINGEKTSQRGASREFMSSGLEPGRSYTYTIHAQWKSANGAPVDLEQRVSVKAGEKRWVDFDAKPATLQEQLTPVGSR